MKMLEAQRIYQMALEAHRVDPDDELVWEEYQEHRRLLEVAWLKNNTHIGV